MTKYGRKRRLFVPVYQFPVLPQLPSSDLCHNLSAHSHSSPALIYISDITSGPGCTQGSAAFSYTPPAFFFLDVFARLISSLCFFFLCLSSFLSLQLFPLYSIPIRPFLLICCVYVRLNSLRPKEKMVLLTCALPNPAVLQRLFLQTLPTVSHVLYELFLFNFSRRHVSAQTVGASLVVFSLSPGDIRNSRYFWHELHPGL